jgi:hypothetical protein
MADLGLGGVIPCFYAPRTFMVLFSVKKEIPSLLRFIPILGCVLASVIVYWVSREYTIWFVIWLLLGGGFTAALWLLVTTKSPDKSRPPTEKRNSED